jgi:hypothetical protein
VTQSHGPKAELSQGCQTADKSKTAKRRRRKVRRLKPTPQAWSGLTDFRKAKPGKPGDAKSWVYSHNVFLFVIMTARLPKSKSFYRDDRYGLVVPVFLSVPLSGIQIMWFIACWV